MGLVAEHGQKYLSGDDGVVTIPNDEAGWVVAIWRADGKRYAAMKSLRRGCEDLSIELEALTEVIVRVVDARGRPVLGMPVSVAQSARGLADGIPTSVSVAMIMTGGTLIAGYTDRKGIARLQSPRLQAIRGQLAVGVPFVGAEPVVQIVDIRDGLPTDVIELKMPPFGQVKAIFYGADGKPSDQVESAWLEVLSRFEAGSNYNRNVASVTDPDGATWPAVGLNLDVKVHLRLKGSQQEVTIAGAGPKRSRELTILTPEAAAEVVAAPTVSIRVLDDDGKPVALEQLGVSFVDPEFARSFTRRTDKDGRVDLEVPERHRDSDSVVVYIMRRKFGANGGFSVALPEEIPAGRIAVGDRKLKEEPVRLAGTVVDERGDPVSGVKLVTGRMFRRRSTSRSGASEFVDLAAASDNKGSFELRHIFDELGDLKMGSSEYFIKDMSDWSLGDTDVKIVVGRPGKVAVALKDPPEDTLRLLLIDAEDSSAKWTHYIFSHNGKASKSWDVPPGTYTLYLGGESQANIVADKIKVVAGEQVEDPSLLSIDWTKYMREVVVKVVDAQGEPVPGAEVTIWEQGEKNRGWSGSSKTLEGEDAEAKALVSKGSEVLVQVEKDGYGEFLAVDVKQGVTAVMNKLQRMKITLAGPCKIPEDMRLGIVFVQDGENQKKRRAAPIHSGRPEPVVFVGNAAEVDVDGDADWPSSNTERRCNTPRPR